MGDTLYLAQADEQGTVNGLLQMQLDGNNGAKAKGVIPFPRTAIALLISVCWEDGTVYAADADGFFRCDAGDTNWQKLLQGNRYQLFHVGSVVPGYCGTVGRQCIRVVWK